MDFGDCKSTFEPCDAICSKSSTCSGSDTDNLDNKLGGNPP